jgi:hypothetical protein
MKKKIKLAMKHGKRKTLLTKPDEIRGWVDESKRNHYLEGEEHYTDGSCSFLIRIDLPEQK